jgi:hypothetical protein
MRLLTKMYVERFINHILINLLFREDKSIYQRKYEVNDYDVFLER